MALWKELVGAYLYLNNDIQQRELVDHIELFETYQNGLI